MKKMLTLFLTVIISVSVSGAEINSSREKEQNPEVERVNQNGEDSFLRFLKQKGTLTYTYRGIGRKADSDVMELFSYLQISPGDIFYDCTLVLKSDFTFVLTYTLSPSEQARATQHSHLRRDGVNQPHFEYVQSLISTMKRDKKMIVDGQWEKVDDNIIYKEKQGEEMKIINNKVIEWKFLEPCRLTLSR